MLTIIYDGDCGVCEAFVSRFAPPGSTAVPFQRLTGEELRHAGITREECANAIQTIHEGAHRSGARAVNLIVQQHFPLIGPLVKIVEASRIAIACEQRVYEFLATRRAVISRFLGLRACRLG